MINQSHKVQGKIVMEGERGGSAFLSIRISLPLVMHFKIALAFH